jgi:hypothetical protein
MVEEDWSDGVAFGEESCAASGERRSKDKENTSAALGIRAANISEDWEVWRTLSAS